MDTIVPEPSDSSKTPETLTRGRAIDALAYAIYRDTPPLGIGQSQAIAETVRVHLTAHPEQVAALGLGAANAGSQAKAGA